MAQDPLALVCVEPHFPGRLGAVADWLVRRRGYHCWFYHHTADGQASWPAAVGKGLELVRYDVGGVAREAGVHWTRYLERGLNHAQGCWQALKARLPPRVDLVLGHGAGLGSTLFVPVALPGVPIVNYFDYFFDAHAGDLAGEAGPDTPAPYFYWRRAANAMPLLDRENGALPWTLTPWQRDRFPPEYRARFRVLHDGVDTCRFARREGAARVVAGRALAPETRVVSFVARSVDRLRGFERFMELANRLVRARQDVLVVVVGESTVSRGLDVWFFNQDYRAHVLGRSPPHDADRFWFLGAVPPAVVAEVLTASDLHVYPSRPYLVSRSLLEAMAAGCVVLAWDSEPVREFIFPGRTGLLVSPDDADRAEHLALAVLSDPATHRSLGTAAAALVRERYSQEVTLPQLAAWFAQLAYSC